MGVGNFNNAEAEARIHDGLVSESVGHELVKVAITLSMAEPLLSAMYTHTDLSTWVNGH